jgi:hypothetical protein
MTKVHWTNPVSGYFDHPADWTGDRVPGRRDEAILSADGSPYTVTSDAIETVSGIQLAANATLAIDGARFTATNGTDGGLNAGQILITNGAVFQTGGVFDNSGGVTLSGANASLRLLADTTLTGGGVITADYGKYEHYTRILGAAPLALVNVDNTIIGGGQIGDNPGFTLVNQAAGVVEADLFQKALILGSSSYPGNQIVNDGLMLAAAGTYSPSSFLEIDHATVSGTGGTIAVGADSNVAILYSQVSGQTFSIAPGGDLQFFDSRVAIGGVIDNPHLMESSDGLLTLDSNLTLTGGGGVLIAGGKVIGTKADTILTNTDNGILVLGGGDLGAGKLDLVNQAAGTIECAGTIDSGSRTIENAGLIEAIAAARNGKQTPAIIMSAIDNSGTLFTKAGGSLIARDAVTGSGKAIVESSRFAAGELVFEAAFNENVTFSSSGGLGGVLELAQSQTYTATISGFSSDGKTKLDLDDIDFVKASEATFRGTATAGVLQVTDGPHTADIHLQGDYLSSTFEASADGHGGAVVVAEDSPERPARPQAFISAMAGLGATPSPSLRPGGAWTEQETNLFSPRTAMA